MTTNWIEVIPVICDCCGKKTSGFYNKSQWWSKYLKDSENEICINCIKARTGFTEEFKEKIGIDISVLEGVHSNEAR